MIIIHKVIFSEPSDKKAHAFGAPMPCGAGSSIAHMIRSFYCDPYEFDWLTNERTTVFLNVGLVFSMLASVRTSGNVLYGPYTSHIIMVDPYCSGPDWPAQLPTAAENHRF